MNVKSSLFSPTSVRSYTFNHRTGKNTNEDSSVDAQRGIALLLDRESTSSHRGEQLSMWWICTAQRTPPPSTDITSQPLSCFGTGWFPHPSFRTSEAGWRGFSMGPVAARQSGWMGDKTRVTLVIENAVPRLLEQTMMRCGLKDHERHGKQSVPVGTLVSPSEQVLRLERRAGPLAWGTSEDRKVKTGAQLHTKAWRRECPTRSFRKTGAGV